MAAGRRQNNAVHLWIIQAVEYDACARAFRSRNRGFHSSFVHFQHWNTTAADQFLSKIIQQKSDSLAGDQELGPMRAGLAWRELQKCLPEVDFSLHVFDLEVGGSNSHDLGAWLLREGSVFSKAGIAMKVVCEA